MKRTKEINAILKDDIPKVLKSLGKLDRLKEGLIYCCQCGITIGIDNIGLFILKKTGGIEYVCNRIECIEDYNLTLEKENNESR